MANLLTVSDAPQDRYAILVDGAHKVIDRSQHNAGNRMGRQAPDWLWQTIFAKQEGMAQGIGMANVDTMFAFQRLSAAPNWTLFVGEPAGLMSVSAWLQVWSVAASWLAAVAAAALVFWQRGQVSRRAASDLERDRVRLKQLLDSLPALVFFYDVRASGEVTLRWIGGNFRSVTGWPDTALSAAGAAPGGSTDMAASLQATLTDSLPTVLAKGRETTEFQLRQPDGSWRWLRSSAQRLTLRPEGGGEIVGYVENVDDLRLAEASAVAGARLASLGELARGLAHELRQPLSAIAMTAENLRLLVPQNDVPAMQQRLQRIISQTERASGIITQLRRFAVNESSEEALAPVVLAQAVANVMTVVEPTLRRDRIALVSTLDHARAATVLAHPVGLEQVITNLLINARAPPAAAPSARAPSATTPANMAPWEFQRET